MRKLFFILLVFAISISVFAGVRINGVGFEYPTIQDAVNVAVDGDRLHVSTGEYAEIVTISNKYITVEGGYFLDYITKTNDPLETIVNGQGLGSVFALSNSTVTFETLGICSGGFFAGGGVRLGEMCTVTARQCQVFYNGAWVGGGIYAPSNSILVVTNSYINNNSAIIGGGIYGEEFCHVVIEGPESWCFGNFAGFGGGVYIHNGDLYVQGGADILGNIADSSGGGVYLNGNSSGMIRDYGTSVGGIWFLGNGATNSVEGKGGGIYVADSSLTVSGEMCVVLGNFAKNSGGGVYLTNSTLTVKDGGQIGWGGPFAIPNQTESVGGGIFAIDSTVIVTNGSSVEFGYAPGAGGGIYSFYSDLYFYGSDLGSTNFLAPNFANYGGGMFSVFSHAEFRDSRVIGNVGNVNAGGILAAYSNDFLLVNTEIRENAAGLTGGGGIYGDNYLGTFLLDNALVISNSSQGDAGGILWESTDTLEAQNGTKITHNFASNFFGGVWLSMPGALVFRDTDVSHNTALNGIGGIGSTGGGHVDLTDCNINFNSGDGNANDFSGALYLYKSTASLIAENRDCEIIGNKGVYGGGVELDVGSAVEIIASGPRAYTIANNNSINHGGGLYCLTGSVVSVYGNVKFIGNEGFMGGGICGSNNCEITLAPTNNFAPEIIGNTARLHGGGIAALDNTKFNAINCRFLDNTASNFGGGIFASYGSEINIDSDFSNPSPSFLPRNAFINNSANNNGWGGGIMTVGVSNSIIANTLFASNSTLYAGSAIASMYSYLDIVNVIAADNMGPNGAIVLSLNPDISLYNSTIANNGTTGVLTSTAGAAADMQNCIVWGHSVLQVSSNVTAQFCDIQDGFPGPFNITNDPMFAYPPALDYQLLGGSECINKGATLASVTNDCIGSPRPYDGGWDIGAYEYIPEPIGVWILNFGFWICLRKFLHTS